MYLSQLATLAARSIYNPMCENIASQIPIKAGSY